MVERRQQTLTERDLDAIAERLKATDHVCQFHNVKPEELHDAMEFFRSFKTALDDSRNTVRRFLIVTLLAAALGLTSLGFWTKLKGG